MRGGAWCVTRPALPVIGCHGHPRPLLELQLRAREAVERCPLAAGTHQSQISAATNDFMFTVGTALPQLIISCKRRH
ncbi:hypothetical protein NDU88_001537 [Pleurodeles waltl]|uniref:Uncharacterized protein n=1 Tax=Pleurodeles waltl TaxID=8319 RepID=A0AAV7LA11_PLEWA|nr:hypothetical protein NDU88_001537 [Pleurodeles waltl]